MTVPDLGTLKSQVMALNGQRGERVTSPESAGKWIVQGPPLAVVALEYVSSPNLARLPSVVELIMAPDIPFGLYFYLAFLAYSYGSVALT